MLLLYIYISRRAYLIRMQILPSMKKASQIIHQVQQPALLAIRLFTQFLDFDPTGQKKPQQICSFFLYTKNSVFEGNLHFNDINTQLTWNEKCIQALTDALDGKRTNIEIRFSEEVQPEKRHQMCLICEIDSGIKVRIFQIYLFHRKQKPLAHFKGVAMNLKNFYLEEEKRHKQQREKTQQEIKEIHAMQKQIEQHFLTEVNHLKKYFIDVINSSKKQLRKHMKAGINQAINQQQQAEQQAQISKRKIVRVNRQKLQRNFENEGNNIDQQSQNDKLERQQINGDLDMLFQ